MLKVQGFVLHSIIYTHFFYKQLENKQLGPVFAENLSNFLSNSWPDFQPKFLSNFYLATPGWIWVKVANYKQLRPDFSKFLLRGASHLIPDTIQVIIDSYSQYWLEIMLRKEFHQSEWNTSIFFDLDRYECSCIDH